MSSLEPWIIPITAGVGLVGTGLAVWAAYLVRRSDEGLSSYSTGGTRRGPIGSQFTCTECGRETAFSKQATTALESAERGMIMRALPSVTSRKLVSFDCPHCKATHYFAMDKRTPQWLGADLFSPQKGGARCQECRKPFRQPTWDASQYAGRLCDAPDMRIDYGLVCARCGSHVCVECANAVTREKQPDGSLKCPRCGRFPVDRFYLQKPTETPASV